MSRLSNDRRSLSEVASAEVTQEESEYVFRLIRRHVDLRATVGSDKMASKGSFPLNAPKVSIVMALLTSCYRETFDAR